MSSRQIRYATVADGRSANLTISRPNHIIRLCLEVKRGRTGPTGPTGPRGPPGPAGPPGTGGGDPGDTPTTPAPPPRTRRDIEEEAPTVLETLTDNQIISRSHQRIDLFDAYIRNNNNTLAYFYDTNLNILTSDQYTRGS